MYFFINPIGLKLLLPFDNKYSLMENLSPFESINSSLSNLKENSSESIMFVYTSGDKYESLVPLATSKLMPANDAENLIYYY